MFQLRNKDNVVHKIKHYLKNTDILSQFSKSGNFTCFILLTVAAFNHLNYFGSYSSRETVPFTEGFKLYNS